MALVVACYVYLYLYIFDQRITWLMSEIPLHSFSVHHQIEGVAHGCEKQVNGTRKVIRARKHKRHGSSEYNSVLKEPSVPFIYGYP